MVLTAICALLLALSLTLCVTCGACGVLLQLIGTGHTWSPCWLGDEGRIARCLGTESVPWRCSFTTSSACNARCCRRRYARFLLPTSLFSIPHLPAIRSIRKRCIISLRRTTHLSCFEVPWWTPWLASAQGCNHRCPCGFSCLPGWWYDRTRVTQMAHGSSCTLRLRPAFQCSSVSRGVLALRGLLCFGASDLWVSSRFVAKME